MTKIRFWRGAAASATGITPEDGEPIWTNAAASHEDKRLRIGTGSVAGGVEPSWPFSPQPGWRSGWYYGTPVAAVGRTVAAVIPNLIYYTPIFLGGNVHNAYGGTIQSVHAEVTGAVAGNFRLGIYNNQNGWPLNLQAQSGNISSGSTGVKTWSTTLTFAAGWYWLAFASSANATFRANDNLAFPQGLIGDNSATATLPPNILYQAFAFGALPSSATPLGDTNADNPAITVRAA